MLTFTTSTHTNYFDRLVKELGFRPIESDYYKDFLSFVKLFFVLFFVPGIFA